MLLFTTMMAVLYGPYCCIMWRGTGVHVERWSGLLPATRSQNAPCGGQDGD